jgi:hypothetical protein
MAEISLVGKSFEESVKLVIKETGCDPDVAEEFVLLSQGGEPESSAETKEVSMEVITTKAGNSASVKKAWLSRKRGSPSLGNKLGGAASKASGGIIAAQGRLARKVVGAAGKTALSAATITPRMAVKVGKGVVKNVASRLKLAKGVAKFAARNAKTTGRGLVAGAKLSARGAKTAGRGLVAGAKVSGRLAKHYATNFARGFSGKEFMGEESLDDTLMELRRQIQDALPKPVYAGTMEHMQDGWIRDIYQGYFLYTCDKCTYKVPYMQLEDSVEIPSKDKWTEVKQEWVPVLDTKEVTADLVITKDAKDQYRWTMFSTNAFEDRDGEVISLRAIENDLVQSDKEYVHSGNYGPLRWWHCVDDVNDPIHTGLDIGLCDFRALEGRILVESGTFNDNVVGEAMASRAKELGGSVGFFHSTAEPDNDKVFNKVRIFERSLLPRERASNLLVLPIIQKEGAIMVKEKLDKLAELLGSKAKADETVQAAKETQKTAEAVGVRTKETKPVVTTKEDVVAASTTSAEEEQAYEDFKAAVLVVLNELSEESDGETESDTKEVNELQATLKELNDGQNKLAEAMLSIGERMKALEGDVPAGVQGHVASTSQSTVTTKAHSEPRPDPMNSFVSDFVLPARKI